MDQAAALALSLSYHQSSTFASQKEISGELSWLRSRDPSFACAKQNSGYINPHHPSISVQADGFILPAIQETASIPASRDTKALFFLSRIQTDSSPFFIFLRSDRFINSVRTSCFHRVSPALSEVSSDFMYNIPERKKFLCFSYRRSPLISLILEKIMLQEHSSTPGSRSIVSSISFSISSLEEATA